MEKNGENERKTKKTGENERLKNTTKGEKNSLARGFVLDPLTPAF